MTVSKSITAEDITITGETANQQGTKKFDIVTAQPAVGAAANNGDYALLSNVTRGNSLGWYWSTSDNGWIKFGLTDTANLTIDGSGAGDLTFASSLGIDISGTGALNVNSGNTTLGGKSNSKW